MPSKPVILWLFLLIASACGSDSPTSPDPSGESEVFKVIGTMTTTRFFHSATLLKDGRVLILGGRKGDFNSQDVQYVPSAELYDSATATFAPAGDTGLSSIDTAYLLPGGKVFLLSGRDVAIFDPVTGTTTRTGHSIGQNRSLYTVTPLTYGRIMFSGGLKDLVSTDEVLVYSP